MSASPTMAVELDRESARDEAIRELSDPRYAADDPTLLQRALQWVFRELGELLDDAASVVPGGLWGVLILAIGIAALIVVLAIAGRRILGERGATAPSRALMDEVSDLDAATLRQLAAAAAAEGRWDEALLQRTRALVRGFEERGLLVGRPGRTADEAATEISALAPERGAELARAARWFDEVAFGHRAATAEQVASITELEQALTATRVLA
jgi:hypothetical protein